MPRGMDANHILIQMLVYRFVYELSTPTVSSRTTLFGFGTSWMKMLRNGLTPKADQLLLLEVLGRSASPDSVKKVREALP